MEGPLKAVYREWKHMLKKGMVTVEQMPDQLREQFSEPRLKRHHEWSDDQQVINDRLRRKQAIEEARKRKRQGDFINAGTEKAGHGHSQARPAKSFAQTAQSRGKASRPPQLPRLHDPAAGSGSKDENREYEVEGNEDYEERLEKGNGLKM